MVELDQSACGEGVVDILLENLHRALSLRGHDRGRREEGDGVEPLFGQAVRDLFAWKDQEVVPGVYVEPSHLCEGVMVGYEEEVVVMVVVPTHNPAGRFVTVGEIRMGVEVALVPLGSLLTGEGEREDEKDEEERPFHWTPPVENPLYKLRIQQIYKKQ